MVEGARLESVYTAKPYRGFESLSLRHLSHCPFRKAKYSYGVKVNQISFLPLGADFNPAVYRVTTNNKADYFLKLRREEFFESAVMIQL